MDEMDDISPGQPTILMRITKVLVDYAKNKAWEMRGDLERMEKNFVLDELIMKKIKKLKMEVTKKLEQNCLCFFSWRRNMGWKRIDELEKKMLDNLDLEQESDKLMMEEIKMLKMEVVRYLMNNLDCKPFFLLMSNKLGFDAMDKLKEMEKMLDLLQKSDKLMMEEIKMLKIKVMKELVKNMDYFSLSTNDLFHAMDELKTMEKMLDLEQESDKLMMKEIMNLKMEAMKKLVESLDSAFFWRTNQAFDAMDELKTMEKMLDLEQESDKLMMKEIMNLKMEVLKKLVESLVKNLGCHSYFSFGTDQAFDAMDELKTMEKMLDLEQESDKLMMKEIMNLKMEVMKKLVENLGCHSSLSSGTDQAFDAMDELKTMEKMLDLEQESDKLMMKEIMNLKMEVMKKLVESLVKNLGCHSYFSFGTDQAFDAMDELKTMEKMLDLEQESDKLMMKEIMNLKMEVMKKLVENLGCHSSLSSGTDEPFDAMDELKSMEKMLDLKQESDKLMMKEIMNLKMEVLKKLVESLVPFLVSDHYSSSPIEQIMAELDKKQKILDLLQDSDTPNMKEIKKLKKKVEGMKNLKSFLRVLDLPKWDWMIKRPLVENMIFATKQKLRCEKRKALLTKNSVYSKKGRSYSETCLSKKKTYSKLNCGYSDVFLSTDDNACSERVCNFSIQISKGKRPLAPASYSRNGVVYKAKKRNSCTEQLQGWTGITVIYLKIFFKINYQIWIFFMATYLVILKILQFKTTLQPKRIHFLTDCQLSLRTSGLKRQIF
ncbi:titin homolog [Dendronephthya gigantea]|uniref:titin homolog n=1 Tax=Dendronephthya gigantea TaxID=151771 RepID=UPI00106A28E1|nr:titin homolog [Dendronephthya gigantea]